VQRTIPPLILLIAISLGSLFFRLGSLPLSGADEPRYARIAQEMLAQENWITPTLEGKPWLEKPPLYYWMTIPAAAIFKSDEFAARVGPAKSAFTAALAIFCLGWIVAGRTAGALGATILLTSIGFAGFGRSASTDMPFTCSFTLAMSVLAIAVERNIGAKVLWAYLFLGLAVLAKGPVAIILAFGIGLCFWIIADYPRILERWHIGWGLLIAAAISVPWFWMAFRQNGYAFIATFFINHNLARFVTDIHHHSQPFYYYGPVLLALIFPWSSWLLLLARSPVEKLRRWREWDPGTIFFSCWFLVPVVFFSLSDSKLAGYILPSLPPLALLLGIVLSRCYETSVEPTRMRGAMWVHITLSAGMAFAAVFYFNREYGSWGIGLVLALAILTPAVFGFAFRSNCKRAFKATAVQGFVVLIAIAQFAFPVLGAYHSTREIAREAVKLRSAGEPIVTYQFFHHSLHYYTNYQISGEVDDPESLRRFVESIPSTLVVAKPAGLKDISADRDFLVTPLYVQADFHLVRVSRPK
jgi:4-amino-4-deoxy-L-arabinose transferase-like glycosyltransferase